jgi:DNA polymerase III alpha subunit
MAAKTKINETGDCIFTEQDAIDILYNDPNFDISKLFFDDIKKYTEINVLQWLLDKCQTDEEKLRVQAEYDLYEKKKFIKVLQFLIYFVDTLRANNIVWGVGRGSSVSSFCLFLIGVHKINPLLYNLDYTEFLR